MYLPKAVYPRRNNKESRTATPKVTQFQGYNANPVVGNGELRGMSNCSSRYFPCISPRPSRYQYTTITTPNAIYSANSKLCWVDGTSFYYDGVSKGTVSSGAKSITEISYYNTGASQQQSLVFIFPDKKYYNITTNTFGTIGTGTYPTAGACPDMDYVCSYNNRVFGVKNNLIYASKFNNPFDFTTFDGTDSAAWADYTIGMSPFTGITAYSLHVVLFKNDSMFELFGDNANNFYKKEVALRGCIDYRSIQEVNGQLYFLSRDGINQYGGGYPRLISQQLNDSYSSGCGGTDGRKYFVSLYNGTSYSLFTYDTLFGTWHKEDALRVVGFTQLDGYLYAMTSETTPKIMKFNSGTEVVSWNAETEIFDEGEMNKKYYSKIMVKVELATSSTLDIYIKTDNGAYVLEKSYTTTQLQVISHNFLPKRCNNFQVKFVGSGDCKIYQIERTFEVASDI